MRRLFRLLLPSSLLLFAACGDDTSTSAESDRAPAPDAGPDTLATSSKCAACHGDVYDDWKPSHHALAHRDTGTPVDAEAFADLEVRVGDARWTFTGGKENPRIVWSHVGNESVGPIDETAPMAIGVDPLVQYLVATGDGRFQVPDMAWDPEMEEWFSIYGDEDREPEEWGHWTGRGMNWNSQCAYCHFTGYRKNHDSPTDAYDSEWTEQGVGCAQCHGPSQPNHGEDECVIDPAREYTAEQWMHSCATCHARRGAFDEKFTIGDSFHDHFSLSLPSQPGLWFPDGQQRDEVYKFTSLMMSKMGHAGITCTDCHDPHTNQPIGGREAVQTNALCLTCHASGDRDAAVINPAEHTFHEPGTPGSRCIDCHMPKRDYMQRDPRSDHRFPIPDPRMTREMGTPNACNDCHSDQGLDWQIEWTEKWYGDKMDRPERDRTRAIHAAQSGETGALSDLLDAYEAEEIDAWKATLLRLMEPWAGDSRVVRHANVAAHEAGPLARAAAAMLIGTRGDDDPLLDTVLEDELKAVRLEAAWAAFDRLPDDHPVLEEARAVARHQSDQPAGAMRMARFAMREGDVAEAEKWFTRAAGWDRTSPGPRRDFAVYLSGIGRTADSVEWLEEAAEVAPENAEIPYLTALAHAELGNPAEAEQHLRDALRLRPDYARAWYNLGLLQSGQGRPQDAIASLRRAAEADPAGADAPYARATIHFRLGEIPQAAAAAQEALSRDPDHPQARNLLNRLQRGR